jgi:hypothetical protein
LLLEEQLRPILPQLLQEEAQLLQLVQGAGGQEVVKWEQHVDVHEEDEQLLLRFRLLQLEQQGQMQRGQQTGQLDKLLLLSQLHPKAMPRLR